MGFDSAKVTNVDSSGISTTDPATASLRVRVVASDVGAGGDGALLDGASASIRATVRDFTSSNPQAVALTDANGDHLSTLPVSTGTVTVTATNLDVRDLASGQDSVAAVQSGTWTVIDGGSGKTLKSAVISRTTTGTVVSAVASKRIKVYAVKLGASAAFSVNWRDGASTNLEGAMPLGVTGGYVEVVKPPEFLFATSAGNSLDLVITGVGTAAGRVSYWDDDAS
jgi:hypothetical protein